MAFPRKVQKLVDRVLTSRSAATPPELRKAVAAHAAALGSGTPPPPIPEDLEPYVRKIALHAYKVLDREVESLVAVHGVAKVFEVTVCASLGAGLERMRLGLAALDAAGADAGQEGS